MLTDSKLRSQVDALWLKFYSGGLSNPLDAIEQFSYLLFLKRLEDIDNAEQRQAKRRGLEYVPRMPEEMQWSYWSHKTAVEALKHLKENVFPNLANLGNGDNSFGEYMKNAECKINKASLLIEACRLIDQMEVSQQSQDIQGDLYEYLLSKLNSAGRNGQFRTPRHIIRMMVQMVAPQARERIGDLAAGTAGFLVNAYQYILEKNTSANILEYDEDGWPHNLIGDKLDEKEWKFLRSALALRGFDNDSGMTMLRIGSMNLMLHGVESPQFFYKDTLSKGFEAEREYDVILMNPPFKGAVDQGDVSPTLPGDTTKSELLFVHLILQALDMGGRCAVIVPDGVLFGSSRAHVELRKKIIEENRLDGVISMPSGVFRPYAGVSTAVLLFTRGAKTDKIWFYDMAQDGFSLDDKRLPVASNDIPDVVNCWQKRFDESFMQAKQDRVLELRELLTPLKAERLKMQAEINRLTFESVVNATPPDLRSPSPNSQNLEREEKIGQAEDDLQAAQERLAELEGKIAGPQTELAQLTRQFWVTADLVRKNKYDLSASRYRQADNDDVYHESPQVTLERLGQLEQMIMSEIYELMKSLK